MIIENLIVPVSSLSSAPTRVLVIFNEPGLFLYVLVNATEFAETAASATAVTLPSTGETEDDLSVYVLLEPSAVSTTVYTAPDTMSSESV